MTISPISSISITISVCVLPIEELIGFNENIFVDIWLIWIYVRLVWWSHHSAKFD